MKFMRICLLVCGLMLAFVGVTYASSFSVSADKYGKVEGNGIEFSFSENNKIIQIAFLTKDNERYLIAGKDGEPIYAAKILNVKYVRIKQVYDTETGKYAYIISGSINSIGDSDLSLLMGYDEQKEAWQLYVREKNNVKISYRTIKTTTYIRDPYIAEYAKLRADGFCQLCGEKAPFYTKNNKPYLEAHHLKWLSKGGTDTIDNVVALCPNFHRKMHELNDKDDIKKLKMVLDEYDKIIDY